MADGEISPIPDANYTNQERVQELATKLGDVMELVAGGLPVDISLKGYNKIETALDGEPVVKSIVAVIFSDVFNPYTGNTAQNAGSIAQNARDILQLMNKSNLAKCYINAPSQNDLEINKLDFDFDKLALLKREDFKEAAFFIATNKKPISDYRQRIRQKPLKIATDENGKKILVIDKPSRGMN